MLFLKHILLFQIITTLKYYNEKKPIIGIYGNPNPEEDYNIGESDYVPQTYINWIESLGGEVMIIHQWYLEEEIKLILSKINGVLFLGGGREFLLSAQWERKALLILNYSIEFNLPLWGTCLGFELINFLISNDTNILNTDYNDFITLHEIIINNNTNNSIMFQLFDNRTFNILQFKNSTYYNHQKGISQFKFYNNSHLNNTFIITSLGVDSQGKEFINSIENYNKNIFGVQFHPEMIPYKRWENFSLINNDVITTSILLGCKFIDVCRKNKNVFDIDRNKYDFINTYENITKFSSYDSQSNIFYFKKNDEKDNDERKNRSVIIFFYIVLSIVLCLILGFLFFRNKNEDKNQPLVVENNI
jgi:gamma-glutamyl hydrolase